MECAASSSSALASSHASSCSTSALSLSSLSCLSSSAGDLVQLQISNHFEQTTEETLQACGTNLLTSCIQWYRDGRRSFRHNVRISYDEEKHVWHLFIDRDPEVFAYIMRYLRKYPLDFSEVSSELLIRLEHDAGFFAFTELETYVRSVLAEREQQTQPLAKWDPESLQAQMHELVKHSLTRIVPFCWTLQKEVTVLTTPWLLFGAVHGSQLRPSLELWFQPGNKEDVAQISVEEYLNWLCALEARVKVILYDFRARLFLQAKPDEITKEKIDECFTSLVTPHATHPNLKTVCFPLCVREFGKRIRFQVNNKDTESVESAFRPGSSVCIEHRPVGLYVRKQAQDWRCGIKWHISGVFVSR